VCLENIHFFALIFTLFPIHETATDAVTTVVEIMYICYCRCVVNISVYFPGAILAQKNMIQQPKQHLTGASDFSIFVTPIIS
jgi:hypothetical protein